MRNSKGFTLIEIIVAVALVALLSAAIAPSVLKNIDQGRFTRATTDVQALANAIMQFKQEVGAFPNKVAPDLNPLNTNLHNTFAFLASSGNVDVTVDDGTDDGHWAQCTTGTHAGAVLPVWDDGASGINAGDVEDFQSHLILGHSLAGTYYDYPIVDPLRKDDPLAVGFRSNVITSDPLDPWGNRYLCNAKGLGVANEVVWVISAGPDGLFQTEVLTTGLGASSFLRGDDVGYRVQ